MKQDNTVEVFKTLGPATEKPKESKPDQVCLDNKEVWVGENGRMYTNIPVPVTVPGKQYGFGTKEKLAL